MKVCFACGDSFLSDQWTCPSCSQQPGLAEGFPAFAPELAHLNDGFNGDYFEQLAQVEEQHFWFRSRNRLIISALGRFFKEAESFLEIGCGTGFVLSGIERAFPHLKLFGSEVYSAGLHRAARRANRASLLQMDARRIPFEDELDVIGAFDVLEHIAEDETVLSQAYKAVRRGGGVILTVPQHSFLWSSWDDISCHKRRYSRDDLVKKMEKAGFRVAGATSFFSFLLPLMFLSRRKSRSGGEEKGAEIDLMDEFKISSVVNSSLEKICDFERALIAKGCSFPAGGSLLCVGMKD